VCKLNKSIYGLRQAPRAWHERLRDDLSKLGYVEFQHAESVFWRQCGQSKVFLLTYVDDILILASAVDDIQNIKDEISKLYEIKDLGEPEHFLGIKLERSSID
jgi:Reverse transcriptase (RNA-dependent DNA polymerase)